MDDQNQNNFESTKEKVGPAKEFIEQIEKIYVIWHVKAYFTIRNSRWYFSDNRFTDIHIDLKAEVDEANSKLKILEEIAEVIVPASEADVTINFDEETSKKISYVTALSYPAKKIIVRIVYKFGDQVGE